MHGIPENSNRGYFNWSCCERLDCFGLFRSRQSTPLGNSSNRGNNYGSVIGGYSQISTESVARSYDLHALAQGSLFTNPIPQLPSGYNFKEDPELKNIFAHESSRSVIAKGFGGSVGLSKKIGIPLLNLFKVMIGETKINRESFLGPLTMGNREDSAGQHGPFYAVLLSEDFSHKAYLVPNDEIKKFLIEEVRLRELQNQDVIISKIVTYKEYYQGIAGQAPIPKL